MFIEGNGKIILGAMVISIILFLLNKNIPTLILVLLSLGITIYDSVNLSKLFNIRNEISVGFGSGFYVVLIGLVLTLAIVIFALISKKTSK